MNGEAKIIAELDLQVPLTKALHDESLWRRQIRPRLEGVAANVIGICQYGSAEMINNAIDHSEGGTLTISLKYTDSLIKIVVADDGIGVFEKIQTELHLDEPMYTILELAKGKLTTDPQQHSGEGIFFTSRMFDHFSIASGRLFFAHVMDADWILEHSREPVKGTTVGMEISPHSVRTTKDVFDIFTVDDSYTFSRTRVPVSLTRYGDENLISRSQARRLLARFDRFKEVILDFRGVESIGPAFADEIFRVFANAHPEISLSYVSANDDVEKMILRAKINKMNPTS